MHYKNQQAYGQATEGTSVVTAPAQYITHLNAVIPTAQFPGPISWLDQTFEIPPIHPNYPLVVVVRLFNFMVQLSQPGDNIHIDKLEKFISTEGAALSGALALTERDGKLHYDIHEIRRISSQAALNSVPCTALINKCASTLINAADSLDNDTLMARVAIVHSIWCTGNDTPVGTGGISHSTQTQAYVALQNSSALQNSMAQQYAALQHKALCGDST